MGLKSKVVLPNCLQGMVADGPKLLAQEVCLRATRPLPSIGACASHKDCLGVQSVVVVLDLHIRDRDRVVEDRVVEGSGGALGRGHFVGGGVLVVVKMGNHQMRS